MRKFFVFLARVGRLLQDEKVLFFTIPGSVRERLLGSGAVCSRLLPHEARQLCIEIRKMGYQGNFSTHMMNIWLKQNHYAPMFEDEKGTTRCRLVSTQNVSAHCFQ